MALMQEGMTPEQGTPAALAALLQPQGGMPAPQGGGALPAALPTDGQAPADPNAQADPGYNGTITVNGQPVQVTNGDAVDEGEVVFITADGSMVIDENRQIIGYVENAVLHPMDAVHLQQLNARGLLGSQT